MIKQPTIVFGGGDMRRPEIEIGDPKIAYFRLKSPRACASWAARRIRASRPRALADVVSRIAERR